MGTRGTQGEFAHDSVLRPSTAAGLLTYTASSYEFFFLATPLAA